MSQMTKDFKPKLKLKVGIPAHGPIQLSWRETVHGPWMFVRIEILNEQGGYESLDYYGFTYAYANEDDFNATDYYLHNMIGIYFS